MSECRQRAQYVSELRIEVLYWIRPALGLSAKAHRGLLSSGLRVSIFRCLEHFPDVWLTHALFRSGRFCREASGT
jgi:hypothetical protein